MILPARICLGDLTLRPLRLRDCRRFAILDKETGTGVSSPIIPARYSWPGLWWWLRRRLVVSYGIEVNGAACGLIGLYDLTPEGSARVALSIFDPSALRKGIGSSALSVFIDMLRRHPIAAHLFAEVRNNDEEATRFWMKMGFVQADADADDKIILSRNMRQGA